MLFIKVGRIVPWGRGVDVFTPLSPERREKREKRERKEREEREKREREERQKRDKKCEPPLATGVFHPQNTRAFPLNPAGFRSDCLPLYLEFKMTDRSTNALAAKQWFFPYANLFLEG